MSARDRIRAQAQDMIEVCDDLDAAEHRVAHLERILRQAVMTHGGQLKIDVAHGEAALASNQQLWIGGEGISFV